MTMLAVSALVNARPVLLFLPVLVYGWVGCRQWASRMEREGRL